MTELADFLDPRRDAIADAWTARASPPCAGALVLGGQVHRLLDALVDALRQGAPTLDASTLPGDGAGADLPQLLDEVRVLRRVLMEALQELPPGPDAARALRAVARVNELLDGLLGAVAARQDADRARDREVLLTVLGHDLRNPVAGAALTAEVLLRRDAATDPQDRELLRSIVRSARRANGLIADLVVLAQAPAKAPPAPPPELPAVVEPAPGEAPAAQR